MSIKFDNITAGAHSASLDFSKAQSISLGQKIDFSKDNPGVTDVRVELYWNSDNDGDAAVLLLDNNKKALSGVTAAEMRNPIVDVNKTRGMVWYKNLSVPGVQHSGDVLTAGEDASAPEETIKVQLEKLESDADRVLVVASTYPNAGSSTAVPFGRLRDCKVMIIDNSKNQVLYVAELEEDYSKYTSVEVAEFYKRNGEWRFASMGNGVGKSAHALSDIASKYGLS